MTLATAVTEKAWLRQHGHFERRFRTDLAAYFREQADRLADAVQQFDAPGPSIISQIFRPHDENRVLLETVEPHLVRALVRGAENSREQQKQAGESVPFVDFGLLAPPFFELPVETQQAIRAFFDDLIQQDYWFAIQQETAAKLDLILESGVTQGANSQRIARQLREELGGKSAHKRALRIARTETTGALNGGAIAQQQSLETLGLVTSKTWFATGDDDVRESHQIADGQRVNGSKGLFLVGGSEAPWPGHWSLPAAERIRCRCAVLTDVAG